MSVAQILKTKTNVFGTAAIAICSSLVTAGFIHWTSTLDAGGVSSLKSSVPAATAGITDCEKGVYSPVQRTCVSQQIFDAEMKRLFAALGLDNSIYAPREE